MAALRAQAYLSALQVLIAKHLFDGGQTVGTLVRQLGLQSFDKEVGTCRTIAPGADRAAGAYVVAARIILGHGSGHILAVVLAEDGEVPAFRRHQPVRQSGDVLARLLGDGVGLCLGSQQRGVVASEGTENVVQGERMDAPQTIVHRGCGIPVVVVGAAVLARLFAGRVQGLTLAQPVVLVVGRIHVGSGVAVVVGRQCQVEALYQQVAFAVLQRGDK